MLKIRQRLDTIITQELIERNSPVRSAPKIYSTTRRSQLPLHKHGRPQTHQDEWSGVCPFRNTWDNSPSRCSATGGERLSNCIPLIVILMRALERKKKDVCMHTYTYTDWLHAAKGLFAVLAGGEAERCWWGGGARAAVCEIEAPDVSQGLSPGMGRNGQIIKRLGRREPGEGLGTSHAAAMGISSGVGGWGPEHSCHHGGSGRAGDRRQGAVTTAFGRFSNCVELRRIDAGDIRLIPCEGIQLMSAEFSAA